MRWNCGLYCHCQMDKRKCSRKEGLFRNPFFLFGSSTLYRYVFGWERCQRGDSIIIKLTELMRIIPDELLFFSHRHWWNKTWNAATPPLKPWVGKCQKSAKVQWRVVSVGLKYNRLPKKLYFCIVQMLWCHHRFAWLLKEILQRSNFLI